MAMMASEFSLDDLVLAYRKAKVDLYYSNDRRVLDLLEYEQGLETNLESLRKRINGEDDSWVHGTAFLGGYTFIPKSIEMPPVADKSTLNASPAKNWEAVVAGAEKPKAQFRLMSKCSIDFHVMSALWIGHVGAKLDSALSDAARGNRLRRNKKKEYNWLSVGSFAPYLHAYSDWQKSGLKAMTDALEKGKSVVGVTADVTGFFHNLDPTFLCSERVVKASQAQELGARERSLHGLFCRAVIAWSKTVSQDFGGEEGVRSHCGLPVGLPASGLVANLALAEFDQMVERELKPLYYGRYVDDIILVLEGGENFATARDVWEWAAKRSSEALIVSQMSEGLEEQTRDESDTLPTKTGLVVEYVESSLEQSVIRFENGKNKVWLLEGETGKTLVSSIRESIVTRTSEWRGLPVLPDDPKDIGPLFVQAIQKSGDPADSLRKAEGLSVSRASFALKLADVEAYARDLVPSAWESHRDEFYQVMRDHMLVLPHFFDLAQYFPRVLRIAVANGDWEEGVKLLEALAGVFEQVVESCEVQVATLGEGKIGSYGIRQKWVAQAIGLIEEVIVTSCDSELLKTVLRQIQENVDKIGPGSTVQPPNATLYRELLLRDLADQPFRVLILPEELRSGATGSISRFARRDAPPVRFSLISKNMQRPSEEPYSEFPDQLKSLAKTLWAPSAFASGQSGEDDEWSASDLARMPGLWFPTRPLSVGEVFTATHVMNDTAAGGKASEIASWLLVTRGFRAADWAERFVQTNDGHYIGTTITLPRENHSTSKGTVRVALGMVETKRSSLDAAVHCRPDLSRQRHATLSRFLNDVIRRPAKEIDYLLLPELSIPPQWYLRFADKLKRRGISLVAGIEYLHRAPGQVHNQIWASLVHDGLGFRTNAIYRQDKQRPAVAEEVNLLSQQNLKLVAEKTIKSPPRFLHGEFMFALLVCSEMTNIAHRTALRGKIDALFLPQWNQDLHTFEALVESAALDIHAYIAQANNRAYGDSRIRAPRKKDYERDIVRVKGGMHDYFVVGEIDYGKLREFQSQYRAQSGDFKPLPDGFEDDFDAENRYRVPGGKGD